MSSPNRAAQIKKTLRVVRKHFKPVAPNTNRTLLDHLLFACVVENSTYDVAERVYSALEKDYYDWNEVRVSTLRELASEMKALTDPAETAQRLKRTLQSVFDAHYAFDVETLKKQNIGQAVKQLEKYDGTTPFVVAYVTQVALGGHAIPVNKGLLIAFQAVGVITPAESGKGVVPGLERAIPKSKGFEAASLMHQLGVEIGKNPYAPGARKLLLEIEPTCKDQLPKRPAKPAPPPPAPATKKPTPKKPAVPKPAETAAQKSKPAQRNAPTAKKPPAKKPAAKPEPASKKKAKKSTPPSARAKKSSAKAKPDKQKKLPKKPTKTKKKPTSRGLAKRKPR